MWWKSKKPAATPQPSPEETPSEPQAPAPAQFRAKPQSRSEAKPAAAPETQQAAAAIHKGVYLSALVYVEGDQPPPDDFTALTTSALKQVLTDALKGAPQGLTMTLKKIDVQNDVEDDSEGSRKDTSFQF